MRLILGLIIRHSLVAIQMWRGDKSPAVFFYQALSKDSQSIKKLIEH